MGVEIYGANNTISGNNVSNIALLNNLGLLGTGAWYAGSGLYVEGNDNLIDDNIVNEVGYNGIHFTKRNTVTHNYITNSVRTKRDGGAIYTSAGVNYLNESNKKRLNQIEAIDLKYYFRDPQTVDFYKQCDLLAIEDIGTEPSELNIYGNISSPFSEILSYRYKTQLFTIMTTNLTTTELKKYYGSRVADRFKEMCTLVSFKNNSYRGLTTKK